MESIGVFFGCLLVEIFAIVLLSVFSPHEAEAEALHPPESVVAAAA